MSPMTEPQPNFTLMKLNKQQSRRYARLLAFVRIWASCSDNPGGSALLRFLVLLRLGVPSSRVAGTDSK